MNKKIVPLLLLAGAMIGSTLYYVIPKSVNYSTKYSKIIEDCVSLCRMARSNGLDLSRGPCLSDMYNWDHKGWVCDVAHWPRESVDDMEENQCRNWWVEARNFVEVDPDCRPIRIFVYGEMAKPEIIRG